jgi:ligand-binding SRPBCC domain-containing protein
MPTLILETSISAPPEVCFDLVRDISRRSGKIALGETATFEETHFGMTQRLTVKVTEFEKPLRFKDEMTKGWFKSFEHLHEFIPTGAGTFMRDTLIWSSPLGLLGKMADAIFLKGRLRKFVMSRNAALKEAAERLG